MQQLGGLLGSLCRYSKLSVVFPLYMSVVITCFTACELPPSHILCML